MGEGFKLFSQLSISRGFLVGTSGKEPACQCRRQKRSGFDPWIWKIPWRRAWQPTPVFLQRIPWTEEPGGLQFIGSQRVKHDWRDLACTYISNSFPWYQSSRKASLKDTAWTSLVVQLLTVHLPMKGAWVPPLIREDSTCTGHWARELQLLKPVCPRAHAPQQEKPLQTEIHTPKIEKALVQEGGPGQNNNNNN